MRIWIGTEQEFGHPIKTMYIEEDKNVNVDVVLSLAQKHNIYRFYFGAGEKNVTNFSFFKKLTCEQYKLFLETSNFNAIPSYVLKLVTVIFRIPISSNKKSFQAPIIKIKSPHNVYTMPLEFMRSTELSSINYNPHTKTYKEDTLIYNSESPGENLCQNNL